MRRFLLAVAVVWACSCGYRGTLPLWLQTWINAHDAQAAVNHQIDMRYAEQFARDFNNMKPRRIRIQHIACIHVPASKKLPEYEDCLIVQTNPGKPPYCGEAYLAPSYRNPLAAVYGGQAQPCKVVQHIIANVRRTAKAMP